MTHEDFSPSIIESAKRDARKRPYKLHYWLRMHNSPRRQINQWYRNAFYVRCIAIEMIENDIL